MWVVSAQYAVPVLMNSLEMMASLDLGSILERLMKLSTISLVVWLAGFFALFQSFLNALAEVMKFGDREFYTDWWNSPSVGAYWRTWNKPVYQFMKRHVFSPLIGRGWSPYSASVMVFLFSGVLHELLVGIPTHNIIGKIFDSAHSSSLTSRRCCIYRDGSPTSAYCHYNSTREDAGHKWEGFWKLHLLGILYFNRATIGGSFVLLRMASKVWECQQSGQNIESEEHLVRPRIVIIASHSYETLAFSALSSAIMPPLSRLFASFANSFVMSADKSFTFSSAIRVQFNNSTAPTGTPPSFAI